MASDRQGAEQLATAPPLIGLPEVLRPLCRKVKTVPGRRLVLELVYQHPHPIKQGPNSLSKEQIQE